MLYHSILQIWRSTLRLRESRQHVDHHAVHCHFNHYYTLLKRRLSWIFLNFKNTITFISQAKTPSHNGGNIKQLYIFSNMPVPEIFQPNYNVSCPSFIVCYFVNMTVPFEVVIYNYAKKEKSCRFQISIRGAQWQNIGLAIK